ncbi:hypothetical protein EDD73_10728 [Heliophilum fasciatum]|uniref:Uncharacterized protein n=1 Tax=Heliophilum fasciatum TaxID=35700 RepID=A0A4R2RPH9_9FIRM|nr:hypothetical protein [Heliophilum fasciatum]TCP64958.1 hypothetical protein EDD73_10728 [Heliophilum fasciatum]
MNPPKIVVCYESVDRGLLRYQRSTMVQELQGYGGLLVLR